MLGKGGNDLGNIADAVAGGDNTAVGQSVLNVQILDVGSQHLPAFPGILSALDIVGRIEDTL